jgi:hypothetical protein
MKFFGQMIEDAEMTGTSANPRPGPQNLLDFLPDEFTYADAEEMRRRRQITGGTAAMMLGNWKSRGFIEQLDDAPAKVPKELRHFRKTELYLSRKNQ